ncbi:MAG: HAMP domain-containing histidine kinase [Clostridia bacterium]|nr:HAMP domain-containing histidine kinase [Clostridia bacterium]
MILLLSILFNLLMFSYDNEEPDTILIINSYNESYNWTNDSMNGILDHLDDSNHLYIEYMDGKNYNSNEDLQAFHNYLVYKYKNTPIDMIITTDDIAFQYALENQKTLFKGAPIFFIGINSLTNYDISAFEKVYGVEEKVSFADTVEAIKHLQPNVEKIHFIVDNTLSGQLTINEVKSQMDSSVEIEFYNKYSLDEILNKVQKLSNPREVILLAYFIVDQDGTFLDTDIMTKKITEISPLPVYGLYHFSFNYGIIGGKLISGYEQGVKITEIIQNYKSGHYNNFYYESKEANQFYFDYNILKKYNLDVNKLPKNIILVNEEKTFYEANKIEILGSSFVVLLLITYIITLREQVSRQTKKQGLLMRQLATTDKMASLGEMMSRISHELNTPLGNITTTTSYLEKTLKDFNTSMNEHTLTKSQIKKNLANMNNASEIISESIASAVELMNAFRIFSEHTNDKSLTKFDLTDYLKNLVKTYHPLLAMDHHMCHLELEEPLIINGYTRNYYKIFDQLIRNTLQHGFKNLKNKTIKIAIKTEKQVLIIEYTDNGHGISEDDLPHLFKPLYKFSSSKAPTFGLSALKNLISEMSGNIACQSTLNVGTTFFINIPLKKEN